jgi:hypothetical protein
MISNTPCGRYLPSPSCTLVYATMPGRAAALGCLQFDAAGRPYAEYRRHVHLSADRRAYFWLPEPCEGCGRHWFRADEITIAGHCCDCAATARIRIQLDDGRRGPWDTSPGRHRNDRCTRCRSAAHATWNCPFSTNAYRAMA